MMMLDSIGEIFSGSSKNHPATFFREKFKDIDVTLRARTYTRRAWICGGYGGGYYGGGQYGFDNRHTNGLAAKDRTLLRQLKSTATYRGHREGAILSSVYVGQDEEMFIPMVDFIGRPTPYQLDSWRRIMVKNLPFLEGTALDVFDSGNSYHGYLCCLMSPAENDLWVDALSLADHVDKDWLGSVHCLRWTSGEGGRKAPSHCYTTDRI